MDRIRHSSVFSHGDPNLPEHETITSASTKSDDDGMSTQSLSSTSIDSLFSSTDLVDADILNDHSEIVDDESPTEVSSIDKRTLTSQSIVSGNRRRHIWNPMMAKNEMIRMTMVSRVTNSNRRSVSLHNHQAWRSYCTENERELFTSHFFQGHSFLLHATCHWHWQCTRESSLDWVEVKLYIARWNYFLVRIRITYGRGLQWSH